MNIRVCNLIARYSIYCVYGFSLTIFSANLFSSWYASLRTVPSIVYRIHLGRRCHIRFFPLSKNSALVRPTEQRQEETQKKHRKIGADKISVHTCKPHIGERVYRVLAAQDWVRTLEVVHNERIEKCSEITHVCACIGAICHSSRPFDLQCTLLFAFGESQRWIWTIFSVRQTLRGPLLLRVWSIVYWNKGIVIVCSIALIQVFNVLYISTITETYNPNRGFELSPLHFFFFLIWIQYILLRSAYM